MTLFKCKMCGGDLRPEEGSRIAVCEYCGSAATLPAAEDERRVGLFNQANRYRMHHEFDRAQAAYEALLKDGAGDAETHFGIVLCRYGVEYVEDPRSHKRVPTCHRTLLAPITEDADYREALNLAPDGYSRELYEEQAKEIASLQERIWKIVRQEPPYDVFLSYKENSETGQRTEDSVLAQQLYQKLTGEGYRVFLARVTLEQKLGEEYEPYIFAALSSAKVMLVLGTRPEYLEAVWVKNEWMRFLDLMKREPGRLLIPCIRSMKPEELPQELSLLQAQDMGKIGFEQDLLHGLRKVLKPAEKEPAPVVQAVGGIPVEKRLSNAGTFWKLGRAGEAEKTYREVTQDYPEEPGGWIGLARLASQDLTLYQGEGAAEALRYLQDAVSVAQGGPREKAVKETVEQYCRALLEQDRELRGAETVRREEAQGRVDSAKAALADANARRARQQAEMDRATAAFGPQKLRGRVKMGRGWKVCLGIAIAAFCMMAGSLAMMLTGNAEQSASGGEMFLLFLILFLITGVPSITNLCLTKGRRRKLAEYEKVIAAINPGLEQAERALPGLRSSLQEAEAALKAAKVAGVGEELAEKARALESRCGTS